MGVHIDMRSYDNTDLNMYQCGMEDCAPGHSFGPAVRDHFLIHYVLDGRGTFQVGDRTYRLEKGQGFLICPDIVTYYQADWEEPWDYTWVGFNGLKAETYLKRANLSNASPIFTYDGDDFIKDCLAQMIATKQMSKSRDVRLTGLLYMFLSQLIASAETENNAEGSENRRELYIRKAVEYMEMNYSRDISVQEIAHFIGLDRSYFCSVFKEYAHTPPRQFLIHLRMNKACELMKNKALLIGDISRSVGYEDPLQFSKVFKKVKGASPKAFREKFMEKAG